MTRVAALEAVDEPTYGGTASAETVQQLWEDYRSTRDRAARDRLILLYAPFVKIVAGRIGQRVPTSVDRADLTSWGILGLVDAIEKFDCNRGVKFETYAYRRIWGAIIDEIRSIDWVPRRVRRNARAIHDAESELANRFSRVPSRAEVATELGTSERCLDRMLAEDSCASVQSFDSLLAVADHSSIPGEAFELTDSDRLAQAINALPDRERLILVLSYFEQLTLAEIGAQLNVTESRVSQIRTKTLGKLRWRLTGAVDRDSHPGVVLRPAV